MTKASKVKLPKELTRKQQSRVEREARQQRWLLIGVVAVLVVTVGLIIFGVVYERVLIPRQPVAKVDGMDITSDAFEKRVLYQDYNLQQRLAQLKAQRAQFASDPSLSFLTSQYDQQISQIQAQVSDPAVLGKQVLDGMIDEDVIRQEAARRNITVSQAEVTQYIEQNIFNYYRVPPTPTPTSTPLPTPSVSPTPQPTPSVPITTTPESTSTPLPTATPVSEQAFNQEYNNLLSTIRTQSRLAESDFRTLVENELLRQKLQQAFIDAAPASADEIKLRYVRLESEPAATAASALMSAGIPFYQFYTQVQSGQIVSATNGETDWMPATDISQQFDKAVADQLIALPISQTTQVITNVFGSSYIFQVTGHEVRSLTDAQKQTEGQTQFTNWLTAQRNTPGLVDYLNDRYLEIIPKINLPQAQTP